MVEPLSDPPDPAVALADFATRLRFEDIPREVVEQTKQAVLDTLGVALAGAGTSRMLGSIPVGLVRDGL